MTPSPQNPVEPLPEDVAAGQGEFGGVMTKKKGGPAKSNRKAIPKGVKRTSTGRLTKRK